ncbi:membrane protein insertase YidC [soil metagenome]
MEPNNTRNTVTFVVAALAIMLVYQIVFLRPAEERRQAAAKAAAAHAQVVASTPLAAPPGSPVLLSRPQAMAQSPRTQIDTPQLTGSLALKGGRIDDLYFKSYRETVDPKSPPVELFRPEGAKQAYFADFGWTGKANGPLPDSKTVWTQTDGGILSPTHPISLVWDNGQGLRFTRAVSVDDQYLFTVIDTVANRGPGPVQLAPYGSVQRQEAPQPTINAFEGATGAWDGKEVQRNFKDMKDKGVREGDTTGGWAGLTDKYWLSAFLFAPGDKAHVTYRASPVNDVTVYEANFVGAPQTVVAGGQASHTTRLFAGVKRVSVLEKYEKELDLPRFVYAVDWGMLWFLTKPIFWLLMLFNGWVGSIGIAILMLTLVRVILTFPLYNKSFASAAEMRKLQPEIEALKKKHPDDPAKVQQETMALYKERKLNPLAGCVPALVPIPIFLALSKVFTVSLELRHAPFGYIKDLSAPDPSTWANLFGLLPWNPAAAPAIGAFLDGPLHIGILAILYGFATWLSTSMSPQATTDPTQKMIFQLMPIVFAFFMAHFASGLLIYWVWSTTLSIVQQYIIMHRHKTPNPVDDLIGRLRGLQTAKPA